MRTVTLTCDLCQKTTDPEQMFVVATSFHGYQWSVTSSSTKFSKDCCRSCILRLGMIELPTGHANHVPPEKHPTFEDILREFIRLEISDNNQINPTS